MRKIDCSHRHIAVFARTCFISFLLALAGCHDPSTAGAPGYSIEGTLSGLSNGQTVALEVNGATPLELTSDGTFEFPDAVTGNSSYEVTVATQPIGEVCTVSNASGAGVTRNVTNVVVTCSASTYAIGGQVSGLPAGTQVVLENNGADALTVSRNGGFTFATPVALDGSYNVTVSQQPARATCSVSAGSNAGVTGNVSNVSVICSVNSFPIGGTLAGLGVGSQVTLRDNGADPLTLSANGAFNFYTQVAVGGSYNVTVGTQPTGQTCTVSNGSGTNIDSDISDVSVSCSANTYTIGGTVAGLVSGAQVTLDNNGADPLIVSANGSFTFATPIAYGSGYNVTVGTPPADQGCIITAGSGANVAANVTDVQVTCVTTSFTTPGSYSFTVPDGVTSLQIVAIGGGGGGGGASGTAIAGTNGGAGAEVSSTLSVTPGQILSLIVGGDGGAGTNGPASAGGGYSCGAGGGGGGATSVDAGETDQLIAGGGGGGGACVTNADGGNGGATDGTGGPGGPGDVMIAAAGGSGGIGGSGASDFGPSGGSGGNGNGGPGAAGGENGPLTGGVGGSGVGMGSGGVPTSFAGGGGGGYGGGGAGVDGSGGGAGGSTGVSGTTYGPASNGGAAAAAGGDGSIVITL